MLTRDAVKHFGSKAELARRLKIRQQSITTWGEDVPPLRQLQLERITGGQLKASPLIVASDSSEAAA